MIIDVLPLNDYKCPATVKKSIFKEKIKNTHGFQYPNQTKQRYHFESYNDSL